VIARFALETCKPRSRRPTRPLKYYPYTDPSGSQRWVAREKGIDVLIALGMVTGAMRDEFDVAVLFSADSDLLPAVQIVIDLGKRCEVAGWNSPDRARSRLSLANHNVWCHWLSESDYVMLEDPTDYAIPQAAPPSSDP
jgi:hypothetical protein